MVETYTCEICGRPVSRPKIYLFEGVQMILCDFCAKKLGAVEISKTVKKEKIRHSSVSSFSKSRNMSHRKGIAPPEELQYEFVYHYGQRISNARRKLNLSLEELARRLGISSSYLLKIEREKIKPDIALARRIERVLNIKILKKIDLRLLESSGSKQGDEIKPITLGDIIVIEMKKQKKLRMGDE